MLKAREICKREASNVPIMVICSYILNKGEDFIALITNDDINKINGNDAMTAEYRKSIVRAAREVVIRCDQNEIVALFKSEWCCPGECYDPDLDQFVTDTNLD